MAWLAVDENGDEYIYNYCPERATYIFLGDDNNSVELPKGSIEKLIDKPLTWADEPVEIK